MSAIKVIFTRGVIDAVRCRKRETLNDDVDGRKLAEGVRTLPANP